MDKFAFELSKQAAMDVEFLPERLAPISGTIGRLPSSLTHLLLAGKPHYAFKNARRQQIEHQLRLMDEAGYDLTGLAVRLNRTGMLEDLKRIWKSKRIGRLSKVLATASLPPRTALAALQRSDYYDPFGHTVNIFSPLPGIAAHELGHAVDYEKSKHPALAAFSRISPIEAIRQEARATRAALSSMPTEERATARKVLLPALGSYVATAGGQPALSLLAVPGILGGHAVARLRKNKEYEKLPQESRGPEQLGHFLGALPSSVLGATGLVDPVSLAAMALGGGQVLGSGLKAMGRDTAEDEDEEQIEKPKKKKNKKGHKKAAHVVLSLQRFAYQFGKQAAMSSERFQDAKQSKIGG
jgi:hypothetical protein